MKKIYIALLLAFYGQSVSMFAQDVWKITADSIKLDNYYGITVANGMVGLVSSPEPLKLSQIVLGETYDVYGRGRVKNFLHGMNMMDVELRIDGTLVTFAKISNFSQTLDMRRGIFGGMFDYKSCVHVEYEYTALRHLPYSCLLSVTVIPHEDVELSVANVLSTHESLRESQESFHRVFNGKIPIDLSTSIAKSPTGKVELGSCAVFLFADSLLRPEIQHRMVRGVGIHTQEFCIHLQKGKPYRFSLVGTILSSTRNVDVRNEVERLTVYAAIEGEKVLWRKHLLAWDKLWESDICIEGDQQAQQDVHNMLYHVYAFLREGSGLSCSPMGLSGLGYNGHVFWDADSWVFPAVLLMHPELAKSMVEYRYRCLDAARHNAFIHGYRGAMDPWESADTGNENTQINSMYGAFEHHITGDVAIAVWQYYCVTQDLDWLREKGYPMLEAIATYWVSRSEQNEQGEYEIRNVIGADEWNVNALGGKNVNNNAYTNGVAKTSLEVACKAARLLELKPEPIWETVARKLLFSCMPNGVTAEHDTYKGEKTKQADVCLLAFPLRIITDKAQIKKDLEYYLQTVPKKKTPAMSKSVYSILYARLGDRERAFYYFEDSYLPNLNPPFRVVAEFDGGTNPYFITGAGGTLQTILFGFGGLDITDKGIIAGKGLLPSTWKSLMLKGIGKDKKTYLVK